MEGPQFSTLAESHSYRQLRFDVIGMTNLTEAKLAAYALIGKPAPAYVALPAAPITRDTLLESWKEIYHQEPTAKIKASMK